jgi:anti-sigma B factor antagonist
MVACVDPPSPVSILPVEGMLRAPATTTLRHGLERLLDRGERRVVLDLARLSAIDAAGIGELVRAFSTMQAAGGVLRIAHANRHVRTLLNVTGVSTLLDPEADE